MDVELKRRRRLDAALSFALEQRQLPHASSSIRLSRFAEVADEAEQVEWRVQTTVLERSADQKIVFRWKAPWIAAPIANGGRGVASQATDCTRATQRANNVIKTPDWIRHAKIICAPRSFCNASALTDPINNKHSLALAVALRLYTRQQNIFIMLARQNAEEARKVTDRTQREKTVSGNKCCDWDGLSRRCNKNKLPGRRTSL